MMCHSFATGGDVHTTTTWLLLYFLCDMNSNASTTVDIAAAALRSWLFFFFYVVSSLPTRKISITSFFSKSSPILVQVIGIKKGHFGGSENCPRPVPTWKCLGALTGKMFLRASISVFNSIRAVGKAQVQFITLPRVA